MATRRSVQRNTLFKVTTQFKVNEDLCHSAHFVWAVDADDAVSVVAEHAHRCNLLDIEMYDQVKPGDSDAYHSNGAVPQGHAPKVYASERSFATPKDGRMPAHRSGS